MKAQREIERFQSIPQWFVVFALPLVIDQGIGAQKNRAKTELLGAAARFADGIFHAEGRDHAGADQTSRIFLAKVVHPVVICARHRGGERWVHAIVDQRAQAAGRIEHGDVDAFDIHRFELDFRSPAARGIIAEVSCFSSKL